MKTRIIATLALSSLLSAPGFAEENNWFVGVSFGRSDIDVSGFDRETGFKIFGGFRANENVAISLAYVDLGEFEEGDASIETDGFNLSAIGILPLSENFELFAKLGVFRWDSELKISGLGSADDDDTGFSFGLGAGYSFFDNFALNAEFQRFDLDGDNIDLLSAGLVYSF